MKLKRIFSLLLAFAMLASLLPANIVFAGEESIEPIKYVFTSAATKEGESVDLLNGGTFTLNNE
ncbi:MAG: hypothetical protein IJF32_03670, partial [Oscillospiraceae bacterium]|nr:hypothetical protein [Oscillospiraceae bacterium]